VKIVLDTNVFVSGIFFSGVPGTILEAWQDGRVEFAVSLEILSEYQRVCDELNDQFPDIDPAPFLTLLTLTANICDCPPLTEQVCADPDDDKFLACALATESQCIVTGDKLLLQVSGYRDIEIMRPRDFVDTHLDPPSMADS
jgi:putative PIN family toxin of toxin-antitoxin system